MVKVFCDRCDNEITEDIYQMIFTTDSIRNDGRQSFDSAALNLNNIFVPHKIYCKKCKSEIEEFANTKIKRLHIKD